MKDYRWPESAKKITMFATQLAIVVFAAFSPADAQTESGEPESSLFLNVDPQLRPVITSVLEYTTSALKTPALAANLTQFGLTDETVLICMPD